MIFDVLLGAYAAPAWVGPTLIAAGTAGIAAHIVINRRIP